MGLRPGGARGALFGRDYREEHCWDCNGSCSPGRDRLSAHRSKGPLSMYALLRRISIALNRIQTLLTVATGVILSTLVVLVAWQVVARYVFDTGLFWADELTSIAVMWAALLGAAGCVWTDSNMRLNLAIERLPAAVRVWSLALMDAVIAWFAVVFFIQGVNLVQRTMSGRMASLDIPVGATYAIVPVSAALMAVFGIVSALNRLATHFDSRQEGKR